MSTIHKLKRFVEKMDVFLARCAEGYIRDLQETFVWQYMRPEKTLDDFDKGYAEYIEELRDHSKFADFCACSFYRDQTIDIESPLYTTMLSNAHAEMVCTYQDSYVLKIYAIRHSDLGKSVDNFLRRCSQMFADIALERNGIRYREVISKQELFSFCETINRQLPASKQMDMNSSFFETFLDDYFYRIVT